MVAHRTRTNSQGSPVLTASCTLLSTIHEALSKVSYSRPFSHQAVADAVQKRGKKALILDPAVSGSLQQLDASLSELFTEHGIVE